MRRCAMPIPSRITSASCVATFCLVMCGSVDEILGQNPERSQTKMSKAESRSRGAAELDLNAVGREIIRRTDELRKSEKLPPVSANSALGEAAKYFAEFMATSEKYEHTADGSEPYERAKKHGYDYCIVTENIAVLGPVPKLGAAEMAAEMVKGWQDSPEHRKNLLDPDIRETGVALARSRKTGRYYAVQMLGRQMSDAYRFKISNQTNLKIHYDIDKQNFVLEPGQTHTRGACRLSPIIFRVAKPDPEKKNVVQPRDGDVFVISQDPQGGVQIKRQESTP